MSTYFTPLCSLGLIATLAILTACQPAEHDAQNTTGDSHSKAHPHPHDETEHDHHDALNHHETMQEDMSAADDHHHEHEHDHGNTYSPLRCEPHVDMSVDYHSDSQPKMAHLLIDGIEYELTEDPSLPYESYISSLGLDDSHGLVWQKSDTQANLYSVPDSMLQAKTFADQDQLNQQNRLYQCEQAI